MSNSQRGPGAGPEAISSGTCKPRRSRHKCQKRSWIHQDDVLPLLMVFIASCTQMVLAGESGDIPIFSFDRGPVNCVRQAANFTYVISSDAQLWWWTLDKRDLQTMGEMTNRAQLDLWKAASKLQWPDGVPVAYPSGLVMNGDMTSYGLSEEWNNVRDMYDNEDLPFPVFPGLGNHDYANNLDCWDFGVDSTTCARNSITILRQTLSGKEVNPALRFFARLQGPMGGILHSQVNAFDWGSAAYSWDQGNWHFIMLHFHPAFSADIGSFSLAGPMVITPSYSFLEKELTKAKATGRKVVLFIHDVDEHWVAANDTRFLSLVNDQPVAAVFCGHWHWLHGLVTTLNTTGGQQIPVFRSGSSEYQTSIIAEFSEAGMRMQVVSSKDGKHGKKAGPLKDQFYSVNKAALACKLASNASLPTLRCAPGWTLDGGICRAPCPDGMRLEGHRCMRNGCGSMMEQSGLLCYPPCADGYVGSGPMCWQDCPKGWNTAWFLCMKRRCAEGETQEGGTCYGNCTQGYKAEGGVCLQQCPDKYSDDGAYCRKPGKDFAKKRLDRPSSPSSQTQWRGMIGRGMGLPLGAAIDRDWYALV